MKTDKDLSKEQIIAADELPGAAIDIADDEKVNKEDVKERTHVLGNNPRNNDGPAPAGSPLAIS
ncbi:MAG: hypothetical protein LUC85_01365 [Bacteroidales bacterium]|nr:hypothetical protein [Bacteroidales bacterium]MCD8393468.1 hypothetical protein [Bacteroidales bacterium]